MGLEGALPSSPITPLGRDSLRLESPDPRMGLDEAACGGARVVGVAGCDRRIHADPRGAAAARRTAQERTRLLALQRDAVTALQQAAQVGAPADQVRRALLDASRSLEALSGPDPQTPRPPPHQPSTALDPSVRRDLRRAASELAALASGNLRDVAAATGPVLALLERARAQLEADVALGLTFQGSYSQTKPKDPVSGGHASAMGPAPANIPSPEDGAPVPVTFEVGARLPTKMYCGGPTKDHILESACGGVALLDYDGDGLLDIYLVTAAELTPSRERVPHRNALYRNLGGWKFEDVSKRAGVDLAAWGSGACAGDFDGDGLIDLYVTNWGPNALFRNRGDGTFEEVAARAGVAAGGWSTGCTFFDADGDGDLDLYVARYVDTTWESVVRAAADAGLAQRAAYHGRADRASRRVRSVLRERRRRTVRGSDRRPRPL